MPRTLQEILDQQNELSRRIANYDPDPADQRDPEPYKQLMNAAAARGDAEAAVVNAVRATRGAGYSWTSIGSVLGTSGAAAQQRYGRLAGTVVGIEDAPSLSRRAVRRPARSAGKQLSEVKRAAATGRRSAITGKTVAAKKAGAKKAAVAKKSGRSSAANKGRGK